MENFIKYLEVRNFKSLKDLKIECSKINLFIGRTNVGKSNLLEALSLLGKSSGEKFYSNMIKYQDIDNLFYNSNVKNPVIITTDKHKAILKRWNKEEFGFFQNLINNDLDLYKHYHENLTNTISNFQEFMKEKFLDDNWLNKIYGGKIETKSNKLYPKNNINSNIKYYKFKLVDFTHDDPDSLSYPNGSNLFSILSTNEQLKKTIVSYMKDYDLELLYQPSINNFKIQKRKGYLVYDIPFVVFSDSILKITFYKAAILSNEDSVLIFEEPEVNSYPPYIRDLTDEILEDKKNQFFISTHSPYIFEKIIQENRDDISVFVLDYKDHESVAYNMSDDQIMKILDYDMDVFLNMDKIIYE